MSAPDIQWAHDVGAVDDLNHEGEDSLRAIAAALRRGNLDQRFLNYLALVIDPDIPDDRRSVRLVIKRKKGWRPNRKPNHELRWFLHLHIDMLDEKHLAVMCAATQKFGVKKTECDEALKAARRWSQRDPEFLKVRRESIQFLRDAGVPEYQPVR
jgi:hypothetical protein